MAFDGTARALTLASLVALAGAVALVLTYAIIAVRGGGIAALLFFGFGWLAAAVALILFGAALIAAAFRRGRMPRWASAIGALLLTAACAVSLLSLRVTSESAVVGLVAAASAGGVAASAFAWRNGA